jgi:hypothetical protein
MDAYTYWWAAHRPEVYTTTIDCCYFLYSPPAYQLAYPLLAIDSFPLFAAIVRAAETAAVVAFAGPVAPIALVLPPVATELNAANVNMLLMVAVLAGFRWPLAWIPVLLTKPTAGIALVWFVVRGEWRNAALPIGVAAIMCVASLIVTPDLWSGWLGMLAATDPNPGWPFPVPVVYRLPVSLVLIVWASRTDRPWALVMATILAMPKLYFQSPAMLLAILPALAMGRQNRAASAAPGAAPTPYEGESLGAIRSRVDQLFRREVGHAVRRRAG